MSYCTSHWHVRFAFAWLALIPSGSLVAQVELPTMTLNQVRFDVGTENAPDRATLNRSDSSTRLGSMMWCGGGNLPREILQTFNHLGGGNAGSLVIIPTASPRADLGDHTYWRTFWDGIYWNNVDVVHAQTRQDAHDELLIRRLQSATAVWIGGGDQGRLTDRIVGTPLHTAIRDVYERGGIVGGTSAGCAIASEVMIAGGMPDPYLRPGFGFLPAVIFDQHFTQRGRVQRLMNAIHAYPDRVGMGVDESTAILVQPDRIRVLGEGSIHIIRAGQSRPKSYNARTLPERLLTTSPATSPVSKDGAVQFASATLPGADRAVSQASFGDSEEINNEDWSFVTFR